MSSLTLVELVAEVKDAIRRAHDKLAKNQLKISKVELEIKATLEKSGGGGAEIPFSPVPIKLGADLTRSNVQTICLELVPEVGRMELYGDVSDELVTGVEALTSAVHQAVVSHPRFGLSKGTVAVNFGVTADGQVAFVLKGGAKHESIHTAKLTIEPAG